MLHKLFSDEIKKNINVLIFYSSNFEFALSKHDIFLFKYFDLSF